MLSPIGIVSLALFAYALASRRLASTAFTGAMLFALVGLVVGSDGLGLVDRAGARVLTSLVLETALVLVLFTDSMGMRVRRWTLGASIAARLLTIGLLLSILLGAVLARLLLPDLPVWQGLLLAAILAPTDAALGQAVVADQRVPLAIRNALNAESGLNDGLALPFVLVFLGLSMADLTGEGTVALVDTFVRALVLSPAIGIAVGGIGGWLLVRSAAAGWSGATWRSVGLLAIAALAFLVADGARGSGFISVWVAGLVTGWVSGGRLDDARDLPEELSGLLAGVSFLLFGAVLLGSAIVAATPATLGYAILSLTVVRMVPVAIALVRSGLARPTILYVGWFGPRGLASIVFAGLLVEESLPGAELLLHVVALTVGLSIVLHGATAAWGARRYAAWFGRAVADRPDLPEGRSEDVVRGRVAALAVSTAGTAAGGPASAGPASGGQPTAGPDDPAPPGATRPGDDPPSRGAPTSSS